MRWYGAMTSMFGPKQLLRKVSRLSVSVYWTDQVISQRKGAALQCTLITPYQCACYRSKLCVTVVAVTCLVFIASPSAHIHDVNNDVNLGTDLEELQELLPLPRRRRLVYRISHLSVVKINFGHIKKVILNFDQKLLTQPKNSNKIVTKYKKRQITHNNIREESFF